MQRLLVRFERRKSWTGQRIALAFEFWRFFSGPYVQLRRHYSSHHWSSKETSKARRVAFTEKVRFAMPARVSRGAFELCVCRLQLRRKPSMPSNQWVLLLWPFLGRLCCCFLLGKAWSHPKWLAFSSGVFQSLKLVTTFWNWLGCWHLLHLAFLGLHEILTQ